MKCFGPLLCRWNGSTSSLFQDLRCLATWQSYDLFWNEVQITNPTALQINLRKPESSLMIANQIKTHRYESWIVFGWTVRPLGPKQNRWRKQSRTIPSLTRHMNYNKIFFVDCGIIAGVWVTQRNSKTQSLLQDLLRNNWEATDQNNWSKMNWIKYVIKIFVWNSQALVITGKN